MQQQTPKWNADLYDDHHHFVADYGQDLIGLLQPVQGEKILDAGCGTGSLAAKISDQGAVVSGVDSSAEMIAKAKAAYPTLSFQVADLTDFELEQRFDAVFSNATLHWILKPKDALACLHRHLVPGGRLVLEMGGHKNVAGIISAIKQSLEAAGFSGKVSATGSWYFPTVAAYTTLLENQGFEVELVHYFQRPTKLTGLDAMTKWIEMFGMYLFEGMAPDQVAYLIQKAVDRLRPTHFKDGQWWADYRRLRIKAKKLA